MWAWLRMLRNVPTGTSCFLGTMAVSTTWPERRTNLTWLPFWLASTKPAASSRRLISRKGCGLSRANFNLDRADLWGTRSLRRLEVKLQCFLQVDKSLFFARPLAGDIDFQALRNIPVPFPPDGRSERSLHYHILSHDGRVPHDAARAEPGSAQTRRRLPLAICGTAQLRRKRSALSTQPSVCGPIAEPGRPRRPAAISAIRWLTPMC